MHIFEIKNHDIMTFFYIKTTSYLEKYIKFLYFHLF